MQFLCQYTTTLDKQAFCRCNTEKTPPTSNGQHPVGSFSEQKTANSVETRASPILISEDND